MNGADTYHNKAGLKALLVSVPLLWYLGRERSFDFLITVLMIVFAAIMLIESWYLLSHRKTGIFGQAATERVSSLQIWGWLPLIWGIVSLIAAFSLIILAW